MRDVYTNFWPRVESYFNTAKDGREITLPPFDS
jgi:hypothetical protein